MRVVDTSAWIETLIGSPTGAKIRDLLPPRDAWIVPTIVQFELARWLAREAPQIAENVLAFSQSCIVVPLETDLALAAADIAATHRLAMADAIVYATARLRQADLLTCDAHFNELPGAIVVAKSAH